MQNHNPPLSVKKHSETDKQKQIQLKKFPVIGAGSIVANKYKIIHQIGSGSFGSIFKAVGFEGEVESKHCYAIKFEKREDSQAQLLIREIQILMELKHCQGINMIQQGFPHLEFYGRDEYYNYYMMSYLGMNLEYLFKKCHCQFSQISYMRIFKQLMTRLSILHSKNIIHRDIKPENFVIGKYEKINFIYMIDFGLSKYYKDEGIHIPMIQRKGMIGTARYASINAHNGLEQSRRDDIESICYLIVYFAKGILPWMNISDDSDSRYAKIKEIKEKTSVEQLCQGLPESLSKVLNHARRLEFEQDPDYVKITQWIDYDIIKTIKQQNLKPELLAFEWETFITDKKPQQININFEPNKNLVKAISKLDIRTPKSFANLGEDPGLIIEKPKQVSISLQRNNINNNQNQNQNPLINQLASLIIPSSNDVLGKSKIMNFEVSENVEEEQSLPLNKITSSNSILIIRKPISYQQIPTQMNKLQTTLTKKYKTLVFQSQEQGSPWNFFEEDQINGEESSSSNEEEEMHVVKQYIFKTKLKSHRKQINLNI